MVLFVRGKMDMKIFNVHIILIYNIGILFMTASCGDNAILKLNLNSNPIISEKQNNINRESAGGQFVESSNGYKIHTGILGISSSPNSCSINGACAQISISR